MTKEQLNEIECDQLCQTAYECVHHGTGRLSNFPGLLRKIIDTEAWRRRKTRRGIVKLDSLLDLITKMPPEGWNEDPKKVEAVIKDDPEVLRMWRKAVKQRPGERNDLHDNIMEVKASQGTSKAYTLERLERESPELYDRVVAGEMSANAAAIEAGFRKVKTPDEKAAASIKKAESVLAVARALFERCSDEERELVSKCWREWDDGEDRT